MLKIFNEYKYGILLIFILTFCVILTKKYQFDQDYKNALNPVSNRFSFLSSQASAYFNAKEYAKAKKVIEEALSFEKNDIQLLKQLGMIHVYMENFADAKEIYTHYLSLKPNDAEILASVGGIRLFILHEDPTQACQDLKKACDLNDCNNYNVAKNNKLCL